MGKYEYTKGLHDLGGGAWAYLQPDGSWGWNNAGLVVDGNHSLLVDTLFDERLTGEMLRRMRDAVPAARQIETVVNTHANGDHTYGNHLVRDAEIIASNAAAEEMEETPPSMLAEMLRNADRMGEVGRYFQTRFGAFDFENVTFTPPNRTFSGELAIEVGDKSVHLIEVGPAHTRGDVLIHVPDDRVVYTGDILFIEGTPILWTGPVGNWIRACDRILDMDVETIVPGHGPITDKNGVRRVQDYLRYIDREARRRYDAGLSAEKAARDIALGDFSSWGDTERIVVNVDTLYREYRGDSSRPDVMKLFSLMAEMAKD